MVIGAHGGSVVVVGATVVVVVDVLVVVATVVVVVVDCDVLGFACHQNEMLTVLSAAPD